MKRLYTHNDLDGIGCGILAKCAFGDEIGVDYCSNASIDRKVKKFLSDDKHQQTALYITDISVNEELGRAVQQHAEKGNVVQMVDHHRTALHFNSYDWGMVKEKTEDGRKAAATSLFYDYLVEKGLLVKTPFLDEFVELVRLYDTWDWTLCDAKEAKRLNDLFYILGLSKFEEEMLERSKESAFSFKEHETFILDMEERKIERYIQQKEYQMIQMWYKNYKIGVVYGEQFHSELGNELNIRHPHLDMIIILNAGSNKVSIRSIHPQIDVSKFAKKYGGGGHPQASGAPLTKDLFDQFVVDIFGEKPIRKDAEETIYNVKKSTHGTLYKDRYDSYVSIVPQAGKWSIFKNKIFLFEGFATYEEAEKFLKRSLAAYMVSDDEYIRYIVKKYGLKETKLRSQFERTLLEGRKEILY